jgi:quinolinate synthase
MAMNGLAAVRHVLATDSNQIHIDPTLAARARQPIDRMLAFAAQHGVSTARATPAQALDRSLTGGIGPA